MSLFRFFMSSTWVLTTNSRSVVDRSEGEESADKSEEESDDSEDIEEHQDEYQITKRAKSCHCSDDKGRYFDTQWNTGTEYWFVTCASQGLKDCHSSYGYFTNCCRA
ncbi:hypothetical protein ACROYT_G002877 [Oculina patagonica]